MRETRAAMCATSDVEVDLLNLHSQALLGLLLCDGADAHADAHAAVTLVQEAVSIGVDGDAERAGRGHGESLCGAVEGLVQ